MPQDSIVARFVGDNHVATCNTSDGSKPRWYVGRPGEAKASIRGGTGGSPVQDAVWRGSGNGLQIVISNIGKKDRGEYCCRLSDVKRASEKCFELTVKEPIEFLDTPTEQVATEGLPYVIKCEVTGDPTPEIQWKVRGQLWKGVQGGRFDQIADGLSITRVSVSDQGFYECAAIQMSEQVTGQQTRNISLRVRREYNFLKTHRCSIQADLPGGDDQLARLRLPDGRGKPDLRRDGRPARHHLVVPGARPAADGGAARVQGHQRGEQVHAEAPCRLYNLTPGSNYTMRIATKGRAGLSDWVNGPMFQTAMGAASALAPNLVAVALLLVAALAGTPLGAARS
ncbi:hypothetical protein FOCC_FOCC005279 [Frankliniella occidentalis]|nr:hypothetical protein FOCC_FOCC005279 [Frankliniella occidentalis]